MTKSISVILVSILVVWCVLSCSILKPPVDPDPTVTPTPTPFPTETPFPDATPTVEPTATPLPTTTHMPTATPMPTRTPSATPTFDPSLIPSVRLLKWNPGETVGVPGGIPTNRTNIIDVTLPPYNADSTGVNDAGGAIQAAIEASGYNDVIYMPEGKYRLHGLLKLNQWKSGRTLRGAGMNKTIIDCRGTYICIEVGSSSDYSWQWPNKDNRFSGIKKGATEITIENTDEFKPGQIILLTFDNDYSLPVISVAGFHGMRRQLTRVISKTDKTLSFFPAVYSSNSGLGGKVNVAQLQGEFIGLESFTLDAKNGNINFGIWFQQTYGSWMKDIKVLNSNNYNVYLSDTLLGELRHSYLGPLNHSGSNGAGLLFNNNSGWLVEDNIIVESFPNIEINMGAAGNVFAYNFTHNANGLISIDTNHAPHNNFNLFEGNVTGNIMSDGYFGSTSDDTLFRNWFFGNGVVDTDVLSWCLNLKRMTRNYSVVGNILGTAKHPWRCDGYGGPNIGNADWTGEASPSKGDSWKDWNAETGSQIKGTITERADDYHAKVTLESGSMTMHQMAFASFGWFLVDSVDGNIVGVDSSPWQTKLPAIGKFEVFMGGPGGFQELDLDVEGTLVKKDNFIYFNHNGIPPEERIQIGIPDSLYLSGKPFWFGTLSWPPFNSRDVGAISYESIPAGYRYVNGVEVPGVSHARPRTAAKTRR